MRYLLLLRSLSAAAVMLAALAVLWRIRPEWPELPASLSSPVTTVLLQQLAFIAAWLIGALVILLVLASSLRLLARSRGKPLPVLRPGTVLVARDRSLRPARLSAQSSERAFSQPFPLIPRGRLLSNGEVELARASAAEELMAAALPVESLAAHRHESRHGQRPPSIALLGPLEIATSKRRRRRLRSQTQQLLAYLALHREGATLDELIAAFLPDVDDNKARQRLWEWVSDARAHLGESIRRENELYFLDRQAVAVDLDRFEELVTRARTERGEREQLLERALALVRGQPLAGTDYTWAASDVRRLHATIVDLLRDLGTLRLDNGNPTGALVAAEQAIALDAYNEAVHQLAMHAESALGLRQAIVERYERLCQELDTRFGLEPEHDTRLLYRRLLSQDGREPLRHLSQRSGLS